MWVCFVSGKRRVGLVLVLGWTIGGRSVSLLFFFLVGWLAWSFEILILFVLFYMFWLPWGCGNMHMGG
ncbi:hypothetical protein QBC34DRAFT_410332 [Podospora aff. communis PSN243]|uniref:Uncharacterized protein n=1 Tax=Podospora aff. communis PSN243 TaxID=3040156 RepID=A0AAV9GE01_9PEZI|nr:hypothetical protein QBC34DRAFT_410332 [Podospora aff. communis PSN243]